MIVRQSTYDAKALEALNYQIKYNQAIRDWNALVQRINKLGGEDFLKRGERKSTQFTEEEITKLINLCHPDKHDGKPMATEMTQKLLSLKGKK